MITSWLQLKELDLSRNELEGSLPEAWGNLTSVSPGPPHLGVLAWQTCRQHAPLQHFLQQHISLTPSAIDDKLCGCAAAAVPSCWHEQYHRHPANILEQHGTGKHYYPYKCFYA